MKTEITYNANTDFTSALINMSYLVADDILRYRSENENRIQAILSAGDIPKTILRYDYIEDIVKALSDGLQLNSYIWVFDELSADTLTYDEPNILFKLYTLKALQNIF